MVEVLRVWDENIDVLAEAMVMPPHEYRSAAESPILKCMPERATESMTARAR